MMIRILCEIYSFGPVEVFHARRMNPFMFLLEIDITTSELEILSAISICLVVNNMHLSWCYAPLDCLVSVLCLTLFTTIDL